MRFRYNTFIQRAEALKYFQGLSVKNPRAKVKIHVRQEKCSSAQNMPKLWGKDADNV